MTAAVVPPRIGLRRSSPAAFVVAAAMLVAAAIGALLPSSDDDPPPTAADAATPAVASRELPVVDVPLESAPSSQPVEALSPGSDRETSAFRSAGQVMSTWGEPAPTGVRAMCTLVVIDDLDRPVPGASVRLWGDERSPVQGHVRLSRTKSVGPFESITGADGRCEVRPPPYRPRARVEKEGVGRSNLVMLSPPDDGDQYKLVLVPLIRPAHLLGRVEHPDGSPAPGIAVGISEFASLKGSEDAFSSVVTDAAGRFECDVLGEARVKLLIVYEETKTCESWFETRSGATCEALLRLPGSWTLSGRLVQEDGIPVPEGATVEFEPDPRSEELGHDAWLRSLHARTDEAGRFEIDFRQPASGRLTASGARFVGLVESPRVIVDLAHPNPEVTLTARASASIAGRVVDEAGKGLAGVEVAAVGESIRRDGTSTREHDDNEFLRRREAHTNGDGCFELAPLHPQAVFTVLAEHGKSRRVLSAAHVPAGTRDLVLALGSANEQRASITLVVSEAETGRRVDRFVVFYLQHDLAEPLRTRDWGGQAYEGTSGIAELGHQMEGVSYDALVLADGLGCGIVTDVTATIEGTTVKVSLPALATLEVDVTAGGAPAGWASVEVERREVWDPRIHPHPAQYRARADEHGRARLTELEPGRYGVRVSHGGRSVRREIDVAPGASAPLSVDVP